ncbi:hypothetical protein GGH13_000924 [Coemansia sp. S155-1]|nr:hypothetical protein GGH13_000924 [Coemansia sp. S155-1]
MVGANTGSIGFDAAPFGGIKESGVGREGSRYGMNDYLNIKLINLSPYMMWNELLARLHIKPPAL